MHWSLNRALTDPLQDGLDSPLVPIIDIHMHTRGPSASADYVKAAKEYGVKHACSMEFSGLPEPMTEVYGDFFLPCAWPRLELITDWAEFHARWIDGFPSLLAAGMRSIKFRSVPLKEGKGKPPVLIDDARISPLLGLAAKHGILVQAHVGDPSPWWPHRYQPARAGAKSFYLEQIEHILADHPNLPYLGVHMGCNPEDLDYLGRMMERFPRYHLDTSATKWVVRELSAKPEAARDFFIQYADRICFGSDLVVNEGLSHDYYTSRLYVLRMLFETDVRTRSMINDPDAPEAGPFLNGLNLPDHVLIKLYQKNAVRLLKLSMGEGEQTAKG